MSDFDLIDSYDRSKREQQMVENEKDNVQPKAARLSEIDKSARSNVERD